MKLDASIMPSGDPRADADLIARAEALGFDAAWTAETAHNPYLPLTLAAEITSEIMLGTAITVAFPRSPMVTAQIAWDLARQSGGRFALGLGTQVRAHIESRFSEIWSDPVGRMREYIESLRAIWDTFQTDARLRYRGEHYEFRLMAPFFNPGPIATPQVPIYLAGVNARMCQLAGQCADGLHAHGFHTAAYLRDVILPAVEAGLAETGKTRADFAVTVPIFVVSGLDAADARTKNREARQRIAFYASTPSYRAVMAHHGWYDVARQLSEMARAGDWAGMPRLVSDEMLHEFAVVAEPGSVLELLEARYAGLADRISIGLDEASLPLAREIIAAR